MILRHIRFAMALAATTFVAGLATGPSAAQDPSEVYWASLNAEMVNMRVGPSTTYPIEWVYVREGLPVKVLRVNEGWRYVEDPDGNKGWMAGRLLSRERGAIVTGEDTADMRAEANPQAPLRWHLEPGVVGVLGACASGWCELDVDGHKGWVNESRLWGTGEP